MMTREESAEPTLTCPACGEAEVHVQYCPVTFTKWQHWVCQNCEMSSRVDIDDALADLAWWQEAARLKREKEGRDERA